MSTSLSKNGSDEDRPCSQPFLVNEERKPEGASAKVLDHVQVKEEIEMGLYFRCEHHACLNPIPYTVYPINFVHIRSSYLHSGAHRRPKCWLSPSVTYPIDRTR